MDKKEILEQYGLTEKEAKLYLASITLGPASITQVSKKAGLKRPTTYIIIDELLKKNLLAKVPKGKKTYYKPEHPKALKEAIAEKAKQIEQLIPELSSLYEKSSSQPKIRFYEGKEKIYKVNEEIFKAKEIWAVFSPDNFLAVFTEKESEHFFRILIRNGGILYDLLEDTKGGREFAKAKYRFAVSEVRFLPKEIKFATDVLVYENKVALFSFSTVTETIIEDESIANIQRQLLQFIWHQLPQATP